MRPLPVLLVFAALGGCSTVSGVSVRTAGPRHAPFTGEVTVSATRDPEGGTQVGVIEVDGGPTVGDVVPEFRARAAQLGANYARIDLLTTRLQWVQQPITQSVPCGGFRFPTYCTRTYYQPQEVLTLHAVGRAFRVGLP